MMSKYGIYVCAVLALLCGCVEPGGPTTARTGNARATVGGGSGRGTDYVTGLQPSAAARQYFTTMRPHPNPPMVTRGGGDPQNTGVSFTTDGGIRIPPGTTIQYQNKGYCMDPSLPAPTTGDEYQLIPVSRLIPSELQGIYNNLMVKVANGDRAATKNMQHLVWALRTAGSTSGYANNFTREQKQVLDSCSAYPGQFEAFHARNKTQKQALDWVKKQVNTLGSINVGGVTLRPGDLLDPAAALQQVSSDMSRLIGLGASMPVERTGFNFGELEPGIYSNVKGNGSLAFVAQIANRSSRVFIYYAHLYVGQVGSNTSHKKQRTSQSTPDKVSVIDRGQQSLPPQVSSRTNRPPSDIVFRTNWPPPPTNRPVIFTNWPPRPPNRPVPDITDDHTPDPVTNIVETEEVIFEYVCAKGCTDNCQAAIKQKKRAVGSLLSVCSDQYSLAKGAKVELKMAPLEAQVSSYARSQSKRMYKIGKARTALLVMNAHRQVANETETRYGSTIMMTDAEAARNENTMRIAVGYLSLAGADGGVTGIYAESGVPGISITELTTGAYQMLRDRHLEELAQAEWRAFRRAHRKTRVERTITVRWLCVFIDGHLVDRRRL